MAPSLPTEPRPGFARSFLVANETDAGIARVREGGHAVVIDRDAVAVGERASHDALAVNRLNDGEWAGACFSPSGRTLFANLVGDGSAGSGMTVAITGPWSAGPL